MKFIVSIITLLFISVAAVSQEMTDPLKPRFVLQRSTCFLNSNSLMSIDVELDSKELIIVISHLGKNEKQRMANRRLYNAKTFIRWMAGKGRSDERIIAGIGEPSSDQGYLDFFVEGDLELRIYFPKNKDLLVQPCFEDPEQKPCTGENGRMFYPCRKDR